ncbi:conserved hypothetical protein [Methanosalsum zhilinae DSM 4017]|uniref:Glycerophosphoryl diester phosphodiesterase membrane domain-containing protein n=1 Tax=Methanosalsum zhilinae (strain DSM 4017 / NBRC 107636 / OCM 62 / WeN5) TaxID=679901 RepID=F7XNV0_METZD|nr:hypothetical protein [Methanosalsum zhilinae]AEH61307.1 conserved hypothetical protein [Methanosalsum zhilinae DSM 4017]
MEPENVLRNAWNVYKNNFITYILAAIITIFGSIIIITIAPLFYGLTYMALKGVRGEVPEVRDVFEGFNHFIRSWIYMIIAGIMLIVGYMLLIIPGIILSILLLYSLPLLVIRGYSAIDAIKESIALARANFIDTLIIFAVLAVLNIFASYTVTEPFSIGMLLTILILPFAVLCYTVATVELISSSRENYQIE